MEFFCPSCGGSNKTNLVPGNSKKKVCQACHKEFTASDDNRRLSFKNSIPKQLQSLHVFYREDGCPRFCLGSTRERYVLYGIAAMGLAAIIVAAVYALT